jgi:hypothetical protein
MVTQKSMLAESRPRPATRLALSTSILRTRRKRELLSLVLQHHAAWQGLRVSFFSLLNERPIRKVYRKQRSSQLAMLKSMRMKNKMRAHRVEDDAILMFTLERVCDAIAQGDVTDLGLNRELLEARLRGLIEAALI